MVPSIYTCMCICQMSVLVMKVFCVLMYILGLYVSHKEL